jgi:hypothetical protein
MTFSDAEIGDIVQFQSDDMGDEVGPVTLTKSYHRKGNAKGWMARWWLARDNEGNEWRFTEECICEINGMEISA